MPRKLKALPDMEGNTAREEAGPETHVPAPAPEARRKRAKEAKVVANEARAEELAESGAALARIQEQMQAAEGAAENVSALKTFRKKDEDMAMEFLVKDVSGEKFRSPAERKPKGLKKVKAVETVKIVEPEAIATERIGSPDDQHDNDPSRAQHLELAESAKVRAHFIKNGIEKRGLTNEDAWEFLHQLRNKELDLEAALQDAWKRPEGTLNLPLAKEERRVMVEALLSVHESLEIVRDKVETMNAQADFELNYSIARTKAFDAYRDDADVLRDVQAEFAENRLADGERQGYVLTFKERATVIEAEIARLDALSPADAADFKNAAAYEAASQILKDYRTAIHELHAPDAERTAHLERHFPTKSPEQVAQELDIPRTTEGSKGVSKAEKPLTMRQTTEVIVRAVEKLIDNVEDVLSQGRMTDAWQIQALTELSSAYADLEDRLRYLQTQASESPKVQEERAAIAESLHDIDDMRATLHAHRGAGDTTPVTRQPMLLDKELRSKARERKDIDQRMSKIARDVQKMYGLTPDEIVARGGLGLGGLLKRGVAILTGQDPYGEWKALSERHASLDSDLGSAMTGRPAHEDETSAKIRTTEEASDMEIRRIEGRQTAKEYRDLPENEEEFFNGSLEDEPFGTVVSHEHARIVETLEDASSRGVSNAGEIYKNIAENPVVELLSFGPEEYVTQLAIVHEAKATQGGLKGRERFSAKKRLKAALGVLTEMQDELREHGIDVDSGTDVTARRGGRSRGKMMVEKRQGVADTRRARRNIGGGGFIET